MTDAEHLEAIRTMIRQELSSIKADIDDHKQTHDELEALVEKRFAEMKKMFPEFSGDLELLREYIAAQKEFGNAYFDWGMAWDSIFVI